MMDFDQFFYFTCTQKQVLLYLQRITVFVFLSILY